MHDSQYRRPTNCLQQSNCTHISISISIYIYIYIYIELAGCEMRNNHDLHLIYNLMCLFIYLFIFTLFAHRTGGMSVCVRCVELIGIQTSSFGTNSAATGRNSYIFHVVHANTPTLTVLSNIFPNSS